jgi:hypothetical protein
MDPFSKEAVAKRREWVTVAALLDAELPREVVGLTGAIYVVDHLVIRNGVPGETPVSICARGRPAAY